MATGAPTSTKNKQLKPTAVRRQRSVSRRWSREVGVVSVAGPHEPLYIGDDPQLLARNPRVEVHVLAEFVHQYRGSVQNRQGQVTTDGPVETP